MTKKELAESKLNKSFTDARMGKITEKEFHKNYKAILKWAEKYGIPHSKEKRMDGKVKDGGRTPFKFFKDIYNSSIKEFYSFQEFFINEFKRRGYILNWGPQDKTQIGRPVLKALGTPDFYIRTDTGEKKWIDSKCFNTYNIIILKKVNIIAYVKENARIFITTKDKCFYLSSDYVKYLNNNFKERICPSYYGKGNIYNGKKCIEISNRESAHISIENFKKDMRTEMWDKNELFEWAGPLKKYKMLKEKIC